MLAEDRRFRIRELLSSQRSVTAAHLQELLGVTAITIRRDLAVLEKEGILVRSHGGAVSRTSSTAFQPSYEALLHTNCDEKKVIAQAAGKLILEGETIFLEGSTTVLELARSLRNFNRLTVVTNSPAIVCQLQRFSGIEVLCTGGDLQRDQLCFSGQWAQQALSEIRVDKAFLGVTALDISYGHSCAGQAEAQIKKMLVGAAKQRVALVDHTKFGKQAFVRLGPITDFNIVITDAETDPAHIRSLREAGIEVIVAGLIQGDLEEVTAK